MFHQNQLNKKIELPNILYFFNFNPEKALADKKFGYCHSQNLIISNLLFNAKQFKEEDILVVREFIK